MKKSRKLATLGICSALFLGLAACQQQHATSEGTNQRQSSSAKVPWKASYTNLNNQVSTEEVKSLLSAHLDPNSVDAFFNLVNDYNTIVGSTGLSGDFTSLTHTEYDVEKISHLWNQKKGDFVGTNCRINSYCLLKNSVTIPKLEKNDQLLFLDNDAIDKGKVFDSQDKEEFDILFSRVPTEATTDVKVHAEKMETFFSQFQFNEKARMLSVVLHDNLDGEYLFVGHVGVLVPADDGFLFVEKLTFEEPYQAIKFASKEDCYKYLGTKYADYTGEGLAKPFIMDNDKWVKL
ncbi:lipoprotein, putative [Streptococcus pneumoniae]|nr:lipoprotein, putative [Streptococcus pneumoniae]